MPLTTFRKLVAESTLNQSYYILSAISTWCITGTIGWQYHEVIHRQHSYHLSFKTMSRYRRSIIDSHLPGYVYLELRYLLPQCSDDDNYNAMEYDSGQYLSNDSSYIGATEVRGSASVHRPKYEWVVSSVDQARCLHCLSWPSQVANWLTRRRNYRRPDSATLDRVVSDGCDVVPVLAHRQCRQHEVLGECQWRLSFSRAETALINSRMPLQQIIDVKNVFLRFLFLPLF